MIEAKFPLGQVVATPGALDMLQRHGLPPEQFLTRHQSGDWGDLDPDDKQMNDEALDATMPNRILSAYKLGEDKLWVITEWDRSVTTLLLPDEY